MSNVIVEGFGAYGTGSARNSAPVGIAMLSGAWAEGPDHGPSVGSLPWDSSGEDLYLSWVFNLVVADHTPWRRVLPTEQSVATVSFYYAVSNLPEVSIPRILDFRNADNETIAYLGLQTTGVLALKDAGGGILASTSGPTIVAETATHCECKIDVSEGTFELYVAGTKAIDASGLTFSSEDPVAQFAVIQAANANSSSGRQYISHLIVRDSGSSFPVGDRKVATLFPNKDDPDNQGWTPRPLHRFGVGILNLEPTNAWVAGAISTDTDIGANEFTIEGQFRFKTLPEDADKMVLFGKWDEDADDRSYELYKGGPNLDNGLLVFRTSTDGANGTVENKLEWDWEPAIGRWYHIALVRSDGDLFLFIDGVQQGLAVADADTYFAGGAVPALGAQTDGSSAEAGTIFNGWQDEFRLTIGAARYTANFSPPTEGFPRTGSDPQWGSVKWLSSWDDAVVADDGPLSLSLSPKSGAAAITPNDGAFAYQTIDDHAPDDDTFIEAALLPATGLFTLLGLPSADETVTVGTSDGSSAAVYTFKAAPSAAFEVDIGADVAETMSNLAAAINAGSGEGTAYGTGTTANADVSGEVTPSNQLRVTALTPGTTGNAIDSTTTAANGSWGAATLSGGVDIPDYTQFSFERLPPNTTAVDSVTFAARQWRNAAGSASTQISFIGSENDVSEGSTNVLPNTPSLTFDTFETDPGGGNLTPTSMLLGKLRINRAV